MRFLDTVLCCLLISCCCAAAGQADPAESPETAPFKPNLLPNIEVPRISQPIKIDGDLGDQGWQQAARTGNFTETFPGDQVRPQVDTEALVGYDDRYLYVAFIARDQPGSVRASLRDRDEMFQDDFVGIMLDTFGDAVVSYEIFVNPIGIQGDLLLTRNNEDESFDLIFESRGKITGEGYQVEMAIPFSSLRFPDKSAQVWKVNFWRNHPRDSRRRYSWAGLSRDNPCFQCQWGTMTGISEVKPGNNLELLPTVIGSQAGSLNDGEDPASGFSNHKADGEVSLGARYAFSPSLSAEVTANPDFSQVESDAAQIDVNTTFALFFPERRPFFQEGSDLYDTWINVVYTRTINDPILATKLTGRMGRTSFGYVGARDNHSPITLPFEEKSGLTQAGKSFTNILRFRQTFLQDSHVGLLATDRRLEGGGAGSTFGVDGLWRFYQNYQIEFQAVGSRTEEPRDTSLTEDVNGETFDNGRHTSAFDGETFWGSAVYASFERHARVWNFDADYWHWSPGFRADNGFVFNNNRRQANFFTGFTFSQDSKFLDEVNPGINMGRVWNFNGLRKDEWLQPQLFVQFKKQTSIWTAYLWSSERFQGIKFDGIRRFMFNFNSNFSEVMSFGFWVARGTFIARNEDPPVLGRNGAEYQVWGTFKPLQQLVIQPSFNFSRLEHPADGHTIFEGYILRTRFNYQFSRELFLRLVVQYNEFADRLNVEPLLTYKINPFTIFFIGSTYGYQSFDPNRRSNFDLADRQFFFKFQYLFQI